MWIGGVLYTRITHNTISLCDCTSSSCYKWCQWFNIVLAKGESVAWVCASSEFIVDLVYVSDHVELSSKCNLTNPLGVQHSGQYILRS